MIPRLRQQLNEQLMSAQPWDQPL
ncbi:hypothetical protein [Klebsiella pneumoniae]